MEVILKEDVKNLGFAHDLVKVRNGYGMNYLIPRGLAILADASQKKQHAETLKQRAHKIKKQKDEAAQMGSSIESVTLTISMKAAEGGTLFGSVTTQHIADALKKLGYVIDKKMISLKDPHIKKAGAYEAEVVLHREVKVTVPFDVTVS
jgi:large subunit ribosomal protein L9